MRIVIDMQGAQAENRHRGIGRYVISLVREIIINNTENDIILVLSGAFQESVEPIKCSFSDLAESRFSFKVFNVIEQSDSYLNPFNDSSLANEYIYEDFLLGLKPDLIYISSVFEGFSNNAVTSLSKLKGRVPVAITLYDLIPKMYPELYLQDKSMKRWYEDKLNIIKNADLVLAISDSSRNEGISILGLQEEKVINISTDADSMFIRRSPNDEFSLRNKFKLSRNIVMYTGGIDHRKNIEGLIKSYAQLPVSIREIHQLVIVCSIRAESEAALLNVAKNAGLNAGEVVFTGYVSDEELIDLYNICRLFVFPSWHEGFGLPALEAMRCGAPVIASNSSSIPEVIGWDEPLFDPHSLESMNSLMLRALSDDDFLDRLSKKGIERSMHFSWQKTAKTALNSMLECKQIWDTSVKHIEQDKRPKLAYVSPLQSARSGIADYSAELLPHLARYYNIDAIVCQQEPVDKIYSHESSGVQNIRSSDWFLENANIYDRIVYHFGNSPYHNHMFDMLEVVPGVVVLHDFYLSNVQEHRELVGVKYQAWQDALLESHGYSALKEFYQVDTKPEISWKYPANLSILQRAIKVIVHSENSIRLAEQWFGGLEFGDKFVKIPHLRTAAGEKSNLAIRKELGFDEGDIVVCSFGMLGPTKQNHRLLDAWVNSSLGQNPNAHLVFVGQNDPGAYGQSIEKTIRTDPNAKRVSITGWADINTFRNYLLAADIGVQLRTLSRGETSGTVLDCMNYGLATIVNANGSMADLDPDSVVILDDEFSDEALMRSLTSLASEEAERKRLGKKAQDTIRSQHEPIKCSYLYKKAIEESYENISCGRNFLEKIVNLDLSEPELINVANVLTSNFPPVPRRRQLLVDISELVLRDARTGIQRVVRSILQELLENPPENFDVQPVYASESQLGYKYARKFTAAFLNIDGWSCQDEKVEAWEGDIFLGLDLQHNIVQRQEPYLQKMRRDGVFVSFVVYDLLPILQSEHFVEHASELHTNWLNVIKQFDFLACISHSVEKELKLWLRDNPLKDDTCRMARTGWFHLGADLNASAPSVGLSAEQYQLMPLFEASDSFLMVGTLEPRKGHEQILNAFEIIWNQGKDEPILVIVGKMGWKTEKLRERIEKHERNGKTLFWFEQASDEFLEKLYRITTCLIASSYGEGFGLPLIEAAQYDLPILARDIPVFREVAGDSASYFKGEYTEEIAETIMEWIRLNHQGCVNRSGNMDWLTWSQSAESLTGLILSQTK